MEKQTEKVRLDKYLWSIRLFKTRTQATTAIDASKVKLKDDNVKPSRIVALGDVYDVRNHAGKITIQVVGLLPSRVQHSEAIKHYVDMTSEEDKETNKRQAPAFFTGKRLSKVGRPTKKERRDLGDVLGENEE